jgi:hypothetical protein
MTGGGASGSKSGLRELFWVDVRDNREGKEDDCNSDAVADEGCDD